MDAIKYLKEKKRMVEHTAGKEKATSSCFEANCSLCPLSRNNNTKGKLCRDFEGDFPEEAIAVVEKWSEENPQKTMMQDFFEKFPNAPKNEDGSPVTCPYRLGYEDEAYCRRDTQSCIECWSRPLE